MRGVGIPPEVLAPISGAIGGAIALFARTGAKWWRYRMLKARVRKEAREGPVFGTLGWVWNEFTKERTARHVLEKVVSRQGERIAHLEGRRASQSGEREVGPNDTDPTDDPPTTWIEEGSQPRALARRGRDR